MCIPCIMYYVFIIIKIFRLYIRAIEDRSTDRSAPIERREKRYATESSYARARKSEKCKYE